ncbi:MAG: hypothetical protein OER90_14295 [Gemmatimonadota bacterium]|nr:hypothetical protein [Gemmatimonadota bacterium]
METNPILRKAILEVVENQLRNDDPPQTRETLARLMGAGHSRSEATQMIASVVAVEMFDVMSTEKPFDQERFAERLRLLPEPPYEK